MHSTEKTHSSWLNETVGWWIPPAWQSSPRESLRAAATPLPGVDTHTHTHTHTPQSHVIQASSWTSQAHTEVILWGSSKAVVPSLSGVFVEDDFSRGQGRDGLGMIQLHYLSCALYFCYYHTSSTSDHQVWDLGGWGALQGTAIGGSPGMAVGPTYSRGRERESHCLGWVEAWSQMAVWSALSAGWVYERERERTRKKPEPKRGHGVCVQPVDTAVMNGERDSVIW